MSPAPRNTTRNRSDCASSSTASNHGALPEIRPETVVLRYQRRAIMAQLLRSYVAHDSGHHAVHPLRERRVPPREVVTPVLVRANSSIAVDREIAPTGHRGRVQGQRCRGFSVCGTRGTQTCNVRGGYRTRNLVGRFVRACLNPGTQAQRCGKRYRNGRDRTNLTTRSRGTLGVLG